MVNTKRKLRISEIGSLSCIMLIFLMATVTTFCTMTFSSFLDPLKKSLEGVLGLAKKYLPAKSAYSRSIPLRPFFEGVQKTV
jgi:hypothetical protein